MAETYCRYECPNGHRFNGRRPGRAPVCCPRCGHMPGADGGPFTDHGALRQITGCADGPDLTDLVALIEFLRAHRVEHEIRSEGSFTDGDDYHPGWMQVVWMLDGRRFDVREGELPAEAYFVGPDGAVYDANGEAL